jgi:CBS domain-containing protein
MAIDTLGGSPARRHNTVDSGSRGRRFQPGAPANSTRPRAADRAGAAFGHGFVGLGIIGFLATGGGFTGLWLALIGWFLLSASKSQAQVSAVTSQVAGSLVRDAMTPNPLTVPTWVTLDRLMEQGVYKRRLSSFPVVDTDGRFAGLVTLARMNRVPPERWNHVTAGWIASPVSETVTASPDDELMTVTQHMLASADRRAVILAHGHEVVGILAPGDLNRIETPVPSLH